MTSAPLHNATERAHRVLAHVPAPTALHFDIGLVGHLAVPGKLLAGDVMSCVDPWALAPGFTLAQPTIAARSR